ncbi:hypothetical protein [Nocardia wallacei]|nr:hypothetical protein [Nocardia wallacei]
MPLGGLVVEFDAVRLAVDVPRQVLGGLARLARRTGYERRWLAD